MPKYPARTYEDILRDKSDYETVRDKLKLKSFAAKNAFSRNFSHADKFFKEKGMDLAKIREHSAKLIGAGALASAVLLASPVQNDMNFITPTEILGQLKKDDINLPQIPQKEMLDLLATILPVKTRPLSSDEEKKLEAVVSSATNIPTKATLEGEHLNTTYGLIGAEQHLRRYPGDVNSNHGQGSVLDEGMAPGLGGWGYFAPSKSALTPSLVETEKWYAVVQTLYLPDWKSRLSYLINWYKYRKVLIVNTDNGNAVVAAIADSGPAAFTGKSFGGSPEVMDYLGGKRYKKGPVLVFFVDDPENKIPLGPVEYNKLDISELSVTNI
jgi:hypothetical protein